MRSYAHAVVGHEHGWVACGWWQAWAYDGLPISLTSSQQHVQRQQRLQHVLPGGEAICLPHGLIQFQVCVFESVFPCDREGAIKSAQRPSIFPRLHGPQVSQFACGLRNSKRLRLRGGLWPRESLKHGFRRIPEVPFERRATRTEPTPVEDGLDGSVQNLC